MSTPITLTGAYTCTHHNDKQRAECPVCLVAALTAERDQLRAIFPQICTAIGNGAFCTPTVSVGFIQSIPNEVQLVVAELRDRAQLAEAEVERLRTGIAECLHINGHLADGEDCTLIGLKRCLRDPTAARESKGGDA